MLLAIEIGGTKLQLALGTPDGAVARSWRAAIDPAGGAAGILAQVAAGAAELGGPFDAIGVGFGGPVEASMGVVVTSHQVPGWDGFPLAGWCRTRLGAPAVVVNDCDAAGLAEAALGAGAGRSPVFYVTLGSGVGGALVIGGAVYGGAGRGAAEVGHLVVTAGGGRGTVESFASGWAISRRAGLSDGRAVLAGCRRGEPAALSAIAAAVEALAEGLSAVVTLLCPRVVVVGGGVASFGEEFLFGPLRRELATRTFAPFAGLTELVPAALGEAVVLRGALLLAGAPVPERGASALRVCRTQGADTEG